MIALYDRDFLENPKHGYFNIQLMKAAAYYKGQNEIVSLITNLSRAPYYTKVLYFQEDPRIRVLNQVHLYDNIEVYGFAFYGKYVPISNEIEECEPDTSIYSSIVSKIEGLNKEELKFYNSQEKSPHLLVAPDRQNIREQEIPITYLKTTAYVHDKEIDDIEGFFDFFKERYTTRGYEAHISLAFTHIIRIKKLKTMYACAHSLSYYSQRVFYMQNINLQDFKYLYTDIGLEQSKKICFCVTDSSIEHFMEMLRCSIYAHYLNREMRVVYIGEENIFIEAMYNALDEWRDSSKGKYIEKFEKLCYYKVAWRVLFKENYLLYKMYAELEKTKPEFKTLCRIVPKQIVNLEEELK